MKTYMKNYLQYHPVFLRLVVDFYSLSHWLGLPQVSRRRWIARLPAVSAAGVLLAMFVWAAGIGQEDLTWVCELTLLGILMLALVLTNR